MSRPKYAPITSSLLVRKGEARPWGIARDDFSEFNAAPDCDVAADFDAQAAARVLADALPRMKVASWCEPQEDWRRQADPTPAPTPLTAAAAADRPPAYPPDHTKRCTLKLTQQEYERLGIVAVKREMSRAQALRQAIEHYLDAARRECEDCHCLGACNGGC